MLLIVILLIVLGLALLQEAAFGVRTLAPLVIALGFSLGRRQLFGWSFAIGLVADLLRGGRLGTFSLVYLVIAVVSVVAVEKIRRSKIVTVSGLVAILVILEMMVIGVPINWLKVLGSIVIFWILLGLIIWILEQQQGLKGMRLKN